jgi:MATE family multidrug resistance protein
MTRPILYAGILAVGANVFGNWVFMYGNLGMPRLGAVGCGVASAIVMWIMFGFLAVYSLRHPAYRRYHAFSHFDWLRVAEIRALVRLGMPIGLSLFMEASLFGAVMLLMGSLGTTVVAGHQIALNVASITFMVPLGLGFAISVRVGQAVGRGDGPGARYAGLVGISIAGLFMACAAVVIFAVPDGIASIYTNDPAVLEMAVTLLLMAAVFQISDGLQAAGAGALRGLKDTRLPMIITFVAYWIIGLPLGYALGIRLGYGGRGLWTGIILGLTVAAVLLNLRFFRMRPPEIRNPHSPIASL